MTSVCSLNLRRRYVGSLDVVSSKNQRKRDDNKNTICACQGGVGRGAERKVVQNAIFHWKRHDNKISKVNILLPRKFVVMAQAPKEIHYFLMQ